MNQDNNLFAFFPYLKTLEPVKFQEITIRDCDDSKDLPPDAIQHLNKLRSMFFLRDHLRIQKPSYVFHDSTKAQSASKFIEQLLEFQSIACFIYSSPHPTSGDPFLTYEHASFFLFQSKRISKYLLLDDHNVEVLPDGQVLKFDSHDEIDGYECRLNNETFFCVTEGSRIFPPTVGMWLNINQNLSSDFDYPLSQSKRYGPVINYFASKDDDDNLRKRILTALNWYNRSIAQDVAESVALVNLAIAFESLLNLEEGQRVTERFKEAVGLLVVDVPRIDSWLTQFYVARSQIVHKGYATSLMFVATDDPKKPFERPELEYRSLVSYGRQVFQVCMATILTGAQLAKELKLSSLLVTNQQRLERICKILYKGNGTPAERIQATGQDIYDMETYRYVAEKGLTVDQLIGTAKLMINQYLDSKPDEPSHQIERMAKLIKIETKDSFIALSLLKAIQEDFKSYGIARGSLPIAPHVIVASLIDTVWHYTFMHYFYLEGLQKK